jgi:hypothetical protein
LSKIKVNKHSRVNPKPSNATVSKQSLTVKTLINTSSLSNPNLEKEAIDTMTISSQMQSPMAPLPAIHLTHQTIGIGALQQTSSHPSEPL